MKNWLYKWHAGQSLNEQNIKKGDFDTMLNIFISVIPPG